MEILFLFDFCLLRRTPLSSFFTLPWLGLKSKRCLQNEIVSLNNVELADGCLQFLIPSPIKIQNNISGLFYACSRNVSSNLIPSTNCNGLLPFISSLSSERHSYCKITIDWLKKRQGKDETFVNSRSPNKNRNLSSRLTEWGKTSPGIEFR